LPFGCSVWQEFESREAMVEVEAFTDAEVWTSDDGWLVSMTLGSPSASRPFASFRSRDFFR